MNDLIEMYNPTGKEAILNFYGELPENFISDLKSNVIESEEYIELVDQDEILFVEETDKIELSCMFADNRSPYIFKLTNVGQDLIIVFDPKFKKLNDRVFMILIHLLRNN